MRKVNLGEITDFIRNGFSIKQSEDAGGFPITRIETIATGYIDTNRVGYAGLSTDNFKKYEKYILQNGDILMSHINSKKHLAKTALYNEKLGTLVHGMNLICLRFRDTEVSSHYIKHYFTSNNFKFDILKISNQSVNQCSFSVSKLKKIKIPLPPLPEQKKIAQILDTADAYRQKTKALIEKYDALTQSLFLDMFGDPVTNPKGWEKVRLGDVGILERGKSKHRPRNAPELLGGEYPLIQTGDVANSELFIESYNSTYSELGLKQSKLWDENTLCITIAANIAKTAILRFKSCFPDSIVGFIPSSETHIYFVHYWFVFFQKIIEASAPESAQKNINLKILRGLSVILPPITLQNQFADRVEAIQKQKAKAQESLVKAEELFGRLMQDVFSQS